MIRLLHFADLHLGVEAYSRPDPATGLPSRVVDFLAALDTVVVAAIESADIVVFGGDAYRSHNPSQTLQREFAARIQRLARAGVAVVLVAGNHDLPSASHQAATVDIFGTLEVPGVIVARRPDVFVVPTRGGPLQVVALPWASRSVLLARDPSQREGRGTSLGEVNRLIEERLLALLAEDLLPRLDPTVGPTALVGHCYVMGARFGSERAMTLATDYTLPPSALQHPSLDYVALGHIHRQQVLAGNPPIVYAGSLQAVDFGEEDEAKGYYVATLDPSALPGRRLAGLQFHEAPGRRFLTIEADARGSARRVESSTDPTEVVLRAIARRDVAGAIVRVVVKLDAAAREALRHQEIRRALAEAHYIAGVVVEAEAERRLRLPTGTAGLGQMEALRLYLEARNTPPERTRLLLDYATELIRSKIDAT